MQAQAIPTGWCQCGCGYRTTVYKGTIRAYLHGHQRRQPGPDYEVDAKGCWVWLRNVKPDGYGRVRVDGRDQAAHRYYYEFIREPIPDGLVIDHLCRNRRCVNPAHMEVVTNVENVMRGESVPARKARQTHCKRGHELAGANVYLSKKGHRDCRACHRIDQFAWNHARKAAA